VLGLDKRRMEEQERVDEGEMGGQDEERGTKERT
jgi:hypothetical protein